MTLVSMCILLLGNFSSQLTVTLSGIIKTLQSHILWIFAEVLAIRALHRKTFMLTTFATRIGQPDQTVQLIQYLEQRAFVMLYVKILRNPETWKNNICSLQENVYRFRQIITIFQPGWVKSSAASITDYDRVHGRVLRRHAQLSVKDLRVQSYLLCKMN